MAPLASTCATRSDRDTIPMGVDLERVAKKYLTRERVVTIIGSADLIVSTLKQRGLGPIDFVAL